MAYIRFDQMQPLPPSIPVITADGQYKYGSSPPPVHIPPTIPVAPSPSFPNTLNILHGKELLKRLGPPDATDRSLGGIALWSRSTLANRGLGLARVEVIDESIVSNVPIKHICNIYVWFPMVIPQGYLINVLNMSPDFMYDRRKHLLIIRSDSLETAKAQAALIAMYCMDKVSYYNIQSYDLLRTYYTQARHKKVNRAYDKILRMASRNTN
jgi:hypothetical protein